jgi:hypothetical protein
MDVETEFEMQRRVRWGVPTDWEQVRVPGTKE